MSGRYETIVIGAGPGGLAAAAMLQRAGFKPVVVDRAPHIGATWRRYYDRLELQSPRWLTSLPGYHFPRESGRWPDRDAVVEYLEQYAAWYELHLRLEVDVRRIDRVPGGWKLDTSQGDLRAKRVVVATGYNHEPFIPDWPGREEFGGELLHASEFRNGEPFEGLKVLVVGCGNSGAEIAAFCAEDGAAHVWLAIRTAPHIVPRQAYGTPALLVAVLTRRLPRRLADVVLATLIKVTLGDVAKFGMPRCSEGVYTQYLRTAVTPVTDHGFLDLLKEGAVGVRAAVERFDHDAVVLADGSAVEPDVVIAATGYEQGLDRLVGHLGLVGKDGRPVVHGARTRPDAPRLHFIGFTHPLSGNIRQMAIDSKRIAIAALRDEKGVLARPHWLAGKAAEWLERQIALRVFRRRWRERGRRPMGTEHSAQAAPDGDGGQPTTPSGRAATDGRAHVSDEARDRIGSEVGV